MHCAHHCRDRRGEWAHADLEAERFKARDEAALEPDGVPALEVVTAHRLVAGAVREGVVLVHEEAVRGTLVPKILLENRDTPGGSHIRP
jgi:hypothetical protein